MTQQEAIDETHAKLIANLNAKMETDITRDSIRIILRNTLSPPEDSTLWHMSEKWLLGYLVNRTRMGFSGFTAPLGGGSLRIFAKNDPDGARTANLTFRKLIKGISLAISKGDAPHHNLSEYLFKDDGEAGYADKILQLALWGETFYR